MRKLIARLNRFLDRIMPASYSGRFDRLSEENQRSATSQYPRSGT